MTGGPASGGVGGGVDVMSGAEVLPGAVTVVITTYQHAHFLDAAIASVLAQGAEVCRILVVDDGSRDSPETVVARYAGVGFHRQGNQGLSAARNTGLALCRTEFVAFLDADDYLLPGGLAVSRALAQSHPGAALVYGAYVRTDVQGEVLGELRAVPASADPYEQLLGGNIIGMHATVLYRRAALLALGGFDRSLRACEDYDVYLRLARHGEILSHDVPVAAYRMHGANMSRNRALMLRSVGEVLARQRSSVRSDRVHRDALYAGIRWWWRIYAHGVTSYGRVVLALAMAPLVPLFPRAFIGPVRQRVQRALTAARGDGLSPHRGRVRLGHLDRLEPISRAFGFDRGEPLDRAYIADFLDKHKMDVCGRVLEVGDDSYTKRYGGGAVTRSDVLHVHAGNPQATYVADLADGGGLPSDAFDCVILTQVLQLLYDVPAALQTVRRILKPAGVLLVTVPGISQIAADEWGANWYWGFTDRSVSRLLEDTFDGAHPDVRTYGNVLTAVAFLHGLAAHELPARKREPVDPLYQVLVTARVVK